MTTKTADSKGRVSLGNDFANKTFIVNRQENGDILLTPAAVIPESELWLLQNSAAMESVKRGIDQASNQRFVNPPEGLEFTMEAE